MRHLGHLVKRLPSSKLHLQQQDLQRKLKYQKHSPPMTDDLIRRACLQFQFLQVDEWNTFKKFPKPDDDPTPSHCHPKESKEKTSVSKRTRNRNGKELWFPLKASAAMMDIRSNYVYSPPYFVEVSSLIPKKDEIDLDKLPVQKEGEYFYYKDREQLERLKREKKEQEEKQKKKDDEDNKGN